MTTTTLKYSNVHNKMHTRVRILKLPELNWYIFYFVGLFVAVFLLFFYVYSINELTRGAYLIKNYEKQIDSLSQENRNLELGFAKSGFLGNLEIKTQELSFEKTQEIKYIQIQNIDNSFAAAK